MPSKKNENGVTTEGPYPAVSLTIRVAENGCGKISIPNANGLSLRQRERLLRGAKKLLNAEIFEMCKSINESMRNAINKAARDALLG